jgi:hypothetical protein
MRTFLLTWNPDELPESEIDVLIKVLAEGRVYSGEWSTGNRKGGIAPGDRALLVRQRRDRGIVASGSFPSGRIRRGPHWNISGKMANYAEVDFDIWLPAPDALTVAVLIGNVPEVPWHNLAASGEQVPEIAADRLEQLWQDHLRAIHR